MDARSDAFSMNTIFSLTMGLLTSFFPHTVRPELVGDPNYTCAPLAWTVPATMGDDGHLRGTATVVCDFQALSGGGYPELQNYELAQLKKEATTVNSGPVGGTFDSMSSETYDFDMNLVFSGTTVVAHELGTIATDQKTRLVTVLQTESITGSAYDDYVKGFNITLDVVPTKVSKHYTATLSVAIDMTKPWYAPTETFETDVVNAAQTAVTNYQATVMGEIQNNI
jgi:hypothetical protein